MTKKSLTFISARSAVVVAAMAWTLGIGVDGFSKLYASHRSWTLQEFAKLAEQRHVVPTTSTSDEKDCCLDRFGNTSRRDVVFHSIGSAALGALCAWHMANGPARAVWVTDPSEAPMVPTADSIPSFVAGIVTIPSDFDMDQAQARTQTTDPTGKTMSPIPSLYVTARPNRPDHVPQAILQGTSGKPPPVLSARFERPTFPFVFYLTPKDYTLEGKPDAGTEQDPWWLQDDLVVSARLDMDGIAATRSPEDLVGRAIYQRNMGGEVVELALVGRGAFGKFATRQK